MSWSLGETEDLGRRASKGAGLPWGLAEEAAFAVTWLEQRSLPGIQSLAEYLQSIGQPNDYHSGFCPIGNGSWISDSGSWLGSFPLEVRQPILLAPFIAQILKRNSLMLTWSGNSMLISLDEAEVTRQHELIGHQLELCNISMSEQTAQPNQKMDRISDDREEWINILLDFAHRTYAPASEMSRRMGAGAGLSDND